MSNQQRLEEYLVGNDGYLKSDISNGKVIMLSGKWGSGKTHFWKNIIEKDLKKEKIPNNYISLYGKTSIEEIKNEVFLKIFESVDSSKLEEKGTKLTKNTIDLIVSFVKSIDINGVKIDLSTVSDNSFRQLDKFLKNKKIKKTVEYLNKSAIICFDDFERKSKDIDLNDLFGFITQLTLNFTCKVVIILNDDVFEGEEKKIFSNVKEKSVSKFLKYEPSIKELFETIFNSDERYRKLDEHKAIILKTIEETEELNARIYIQVFDNLVEWIKNQEKDDNTLRCLILVNVNFILYHTIVFKKMEKNEELYVYVINKLSNEKYYYNRVTANKRNINSFDKYKIELQRYDNNKSFNKLEETDEMVRKRFQFIEDNLILFKSDYFANKLDILRNVDNKTSQKINNFIESGILINE